MRYSRLANLTVVFGVLLLLHAPSEAHAIEEVVHTLKSSGNSHWTWAPEHRKVICLDRSEPTLTVYSFSGEEVFRKDVRKSSSQVEVVGDSIVVAFRSSKTRQGVSGGRTSRSRPGRASKVEQEPAGFHIIPIDSPDSLKTFKIDESIGDFFLNPEKTDRIHFLHVENSNRFLGTMLLKSGNVTWEQYEGADKNRRKVEKVAPFIAIGPNGPVAATNGSHLSRLPLKSVTPLVVDHNQSNQSQSSSPFGGGYGRGSGRASGSVTSSRSNQYVSGDARLLSNGTSVIDNQSMEEVFQFPKSKSPFTSQGGFGGSSGGSKPKVVRGPVAFHQEYDLVAYAAYDTLKFYSLSNRRLIRSWGLSDHSDGTRRLIHPQIVRVNGDRAFVAYTHNAFVIEFEGAFEKGLAKQSRLPPIPPQVLGSGAPFELDLKKLTDGKTQFKLKDQPEGMRINKGVLRWTPGKNESGLFTATVVMTADGKADRVSVNFIVQPRSCELGFVPDGVRFDRTGDRLVCWLDRNIAIVDTKNLKVISATKLGASIKNASIENNHCYVNIEGSRAINRFDARALRKEPLRIQETDESKLQNISAFAKSGLERPRKRIAEEYWTDFATVRTLRNDKLVAIVDAGDFPVIPQTDFIAQHRAKTRRISKFRNDSRFAIKEKLYPWEVVARTTEKPNTRAIDAWLEFRSTLFSDDETASSDTRIWLGNFPRDKSDRTKMFHLNDRLVIFYRQHIFSIHLPNYEGPEKFQLRWPELQQLSANENVELKVTAIGGGGKYRFVMKHSVAGLTLNPTNGTLRVDGPMLWKANLRSIEQHQNLIAESNRGDRLHTWKRQFIKRHESTTGFRLPNGKLPALIPVWIVANDETDQRDEILFYLLMHGDPIAQPEVVSKQTLDRIDQDKRKTVQLQRRLDSVEQSFNSSIRSLSIIESLLQQKLDRLKRETKKRETKKREEAGQPKID